MLQLKKIGKYDYEKPRTAHQYQSISAWKDDEGGEYADINCFKRKDGTTLAHVAIYEEAEGARSYQENRCYLLDGDQLTPIEDNPPIAGHPLEWFCDELGRLDFVLNETYTAGNEKIWERLSDETSNGDYRVVRQSANTIAITPFYEGRAISPVLMDWNGETFTKREPLLKNYIHDNSFGPICCAQKFPDLSTLHEYKAVENGGKIKLLKNSATVAEFSLSDGLVKDFDVLSPEYQFWQGWGVGTPTESMYKHFNKIEKDDDGNCYVPWFDKVRFYFDNADILNADLQNPQWKPGSKIKKVRVIGDEPQS